MGNILDELTNILAVDCDECGGAGFIILWVTITILMSSHAIA
jgi:hypothetical protein